jgi:hypothetical protein
MEELKEKELSKNDLSFPEDSRKEEVIHALEEVNKYIAD